MSKAQFKIWYLLIAMVLPGTGTSRAQIEGPDGHYYQVVLEPNLLWKDAKVRAQESTFHGVHGYLATITSTEEDQFLENLRQQAAPGGYGALWVGGAQIGTGTLPTDGWYWVNGEGPIPTSAGGDGYSNWQPGEPNDYWGPQSEGYLSIGHFNQFGWNDEPNDRNVFGYIIEYPSRGTTASVGVTAANPIATEKNNSTGDGAEIDPAVFVFSRTGDLSMELPIFYSVHGTAINGVDYNEIAHSIIIPAGKSEVRLEIVPKSDVLAVVEPMETVGIRIEPSQILTPTAAYYIDEERRVDAAVIFEGQPAKRDAIEIALPRNEFVYKAGEAVTLMAAYSATGAVSTATSPVKFYANNQLLGAGVLDHSIDNLYFYKFTWENPPVGASTVVAVVPQPIDNPPHSSSITITVEGAPEPTVVSLRFLQTTEPLPNADFAPGYIEVTRTGSTEQNLQVFYGLGGTAIAGSDYETLPGYVVIPAGKTTAKIVVVAIDDTIDEPTETVVVSLSPQPSQTNDPVPYTIDPQHASVEVQIFDNDEPAPSPPAVVRIDAVDPIATEQQPEGGQAAHTAILRVSRSGDTNSELLLFYSVHGTAVNGSDYDLLPGTITIPAGKASADIRIVPHADTPSTGHKYEVVQDGGVTWSQARERARQHIYLNVIAHLATITSAEEDAVIESLRQEAGGLVLWVGGYQDPTELSVKDGWKWDNDEGPIPGSNGGAAYAHWLEGEPNDYAGPGSENGMVIGWLNQFGWNDQNLNQGASGYVIEYDVDDPVVSAREIMETVGIRLEPSSAMNPLPGYTIDPTHRSAAAAIFDGQAPIDGAIEVAIPGAAESMNADNVEFVFEAYHPFTQLTILDVYIDDVKVGASTVAAAPERVGGVFEHHFKWANPINGQHVLQARATLPGGRTLTSSRVPFRVEGAPNAIPAVKLFEPAEGATYLENAAIHVAAGAADADGTIAKIEILVDEVVVASKEAPAFETNFVATVGTHTLTARATDNAGAVGVSAPVHILVRHPDTVAFVRRELPAAYSPGVSFLVTLRADPPEGTLAYAIEDRPPAGWRVSDVSGDGAFDATTGKVKFGPFTDDAARTFMYRVTPPTSASGRYEFGGSSSVNGALYPITGDSAITLAQQYHPADSNQDFKIPLAEVTAYTAAWKAGRSWPTGPVPIPVSYVTRARYIWQHGEAYRFDPSAGAPPACWVPSSGPAALFAAAIGGAQRSVTDLRSGAATQVQINAAPASGSSGYAVEEKPPRGWTISNISHEGVYDAVTGTIRWGVFADATARTLTYTVTPPPTVTSVGVLAGQLSYDGKLVEITAESGLANSVTSNGATQMRINNFTQSAVGVTLNISGPAGQTAVVEGSTDFTDWTEVKSIFIPNGSVDCTDESAASTHRFYRLRAQ